MVADTYQARTWRHTNYLQKYIYIYISRTRYTRSWYQRPGTTNHPHHLGTNVMFFLPRPHRITKTSLWINIIHPLPLHFDYYFAFRVTVYCFCLFALGVVANVCCWFFSFGIVVDYFLCTSLLFTPGYFVFTWWPAPTDLYPRTHFTRFLRWCASIHTETLVGGGWCWLDNVQRFSLRKWFHFGDPGKSNNILPLDFVHNPVWELPTSFGRHASLFAVFRCIDEKSCRT